MGEAPCFAHLLDDRGEIPDAPRIRIERVYDLADKDHGEARVLVDRVWPRGIRKDSLNLDRWVKDIAPSQTLRRWFAHDPKKWSDFQYRYRIELAGKAAALRELAQIARDRPLVLLYSARDKEHNQAVVLKDVLEEGIRNS
ncbi:MAG TPA: DUF488 family protein [Candidatus Dormibacteraeota bacterium]|nr:DUF488 family protein [Candidatus Dormibacteraeota bacterium]